MVPDDGCSGVGAFLGEETMGTLSCFGGSSTGMFGTGGVSASTSADGAGCSCDCSSISSLAGNTGASTELG